MMAGLFVVAAMVMWLATEVIVSLGFRGTPIPQIVWLRYGFHVLLMVTLLGPPTRMSFVRTRRPGLQLIRSLMMLAMPLGYMLAARAARGSAVLAVLAASPLLVVTVARAAGETVPRWAVILSATGWIGALVLYRPDLLAMGWGALAAAGMASSYSAFVVLTRVLDRTEGLLTNLFHCALGVFVVLSLAAPWFWQPIGARELLAGAAVAVSGLIVLYLLELGLRRDTASRLAPFLLAQPLLEGVLRVVHGGERPGAADVFGCGLIAAAIAVAFLALGRQPIAAGRHSAA
jgi:drug/metabolite transporter (DMT)-like permease